MKEKLVAIGAKAASKLPACIRNNGGVIASGAGVLMLVAGGVWTAVKAHKVEEIHCEHLYRRDKMKEALESGEVDLTDEGGEVVPYTQKDYRRDVAWDYGHEFLDYSKELAGPILMQVGGAGAVMATAFVQKNTIVRLNTDLAKAAITIEGLNKTVNALNNYINRYRKNVIDDLGKEADRKYSMGIVEQEYEETITQKNGKEKTVKRVKQIIDRKRLANPYAIPLRYTNIWEVASRYDYDNPKQRELIMDAVISKQNYMQILFDSSAIDKNDGTTSPRLLDMFKVYEALDCRDYLTDYQRVLEKNAGWTDESNESPSHIEFDLFEVDGELYLDFNCWGGLLLHQQAKCNIYLKPYKSSNI